MDYSMWTALGSLAVAIVALFYTRRGGLRDDARYTAERNTDTDKRTREVALAVCRENQDAYQREVRAEFRRVFEYLDKLSNGQGELRGTIQGLHTIMDTMMRGKE